MKIVQKKIVRYFTGIRDYMPEIRTDEEGGGDPGTWGNALGIDTFWEPTDVEIVYEDKRAKWWKGKYRRREW